MNQTDFDDEMRAEYARREPRTAAERQHHAQAKMLQTQARLRALERLPSDPARLERTHDDRAWR